MTLIGVPSVADRLGVSTMTIWRLIADGQLPTVRVRSRVLVDEQDLEDYVGRRKTKKSVATA